MSSVARAGRTLLWAVGVATRAAGATALATIVVVTVLTIVNPRFDAHFDHYAWLQMLLGALMSLVFALSYLWLVQRTGRALSRPWALAALATVSVSLIEPA